MGKSKYLTVLASFVLALGLYGCSGENSPVDPVNPNNGGTEKPEAKGKQFRGFIDSTAMRESNGSRTLGVYGELDPVTHKTGITFYWDEIEDDTWPYLFIFNDANSAWYQLRTRDVLTRDAKNRITSASWSLGGLQLDKETYKIRYGNNTNSNQAAIANNQIQLQPGQASNLRSYGDCGTAIAEDNGLYYDFTLKHSASYITFMPYAGGSATDESHKVLVNCKLWRVKISSDQSMSGVSFSFNDNGFVQSPWPTGGYNFLQLECANNTTQKYDIPSSKNAAKDNGAIMVLAPGTYTNVKIEYTVYDPVVQSSAIFTKKIPTLTLNPGKNLPIYSALTCKDYSSQFGLYHMWGAKDYYWNSVFPAAHNWGQFGIPAQANYPSTAQLRYFDNVDGANAGAVDAPSGTLDATAPTANLLHWYMTKGDPRWDPEPFTYDGHLFTGRVWFLKASVIAPLYGLTESTLSTQILGGSNINNGYQSVNATPQPWELVPEAQRSNYFYVVPLGYYENGQLKMLESTSYGHSYFWSSTAYNYSAGSSYNNNYSFYFRIQISNPYTNSSSAYLHMEGDTDNENLRTRGYQTWPGEQFTYN
jgi:hypothetical protein